MNNQDVVDFLKLPWRVGRKVGSTVYAQGGDRPSDGDCLIGVFDTRELAADAVRAYNAGIPSPK